VGWPEYVARCCLAAGSGSSVIRRRRNSSGRRWPAACLDRDQHARRLANRVARRAALHPPTCYPLPCAARALRGPLQFAAARTRAPDWPSPRAPRDGDRLGMLDTVRGVTRLEEFLQGSVPRRRRRCGSGTRVPMVNRSARRSAPQPALQVVDEVLDLLFRGWLLERAAPDLVLELHHGAG